MNPKYRTSRFTFTARLVSTLVVLVLLLSPLGVSPASAAPKDVALQFDGTNDYVTFGSSAGLTSLGVQAFTIETWFKRTGTGVATSTGTGGLSAAIPLVTKGRGEAENSNVDMNYFFGIDTATGRLAADFEECAASMGAPCVSGGTAGLNHPAYGATVIQNNVWYHAAVTYDGQYWKFYLNGVQDGATTDVGAVRYPRWDSIQHAGLGTAMNSTGAPVGYFAGLLDEVRIWSVVRTQAQIQADMNNELTTGTGLIGRWGLNEGTGTTAANSIAGRPNGTLTNGPVWYTADLIPPTAPTSLEAVAYNGGVTLTWTAPADADLAGYNVYRATAPSVPLSSPINGGTLVTATSYTDSGLTNDTPYYYVVTAVDTSANQSLASNETSATPLASLGSAVAFDGVNDYVTFGPNLNATSFTLEAWVKRAAGGATMTTGSLGLDGTSGRPLAYPVLTKGMGQGETPANINMNYFLGITSTGVVGADFEDTAGGVNHPAWGSTSIPVGEWHHIAATYDGSCWSLYLDGNLETLNGLATACPNATPEFTSIQHAGLAAGIGSTGQLSTGFFAGTIDEARVWNVVRTQAQLRSTINSELTSGSGLIGRWGMNEGSGTVIASSVGTTPGTLTNGPLWGPGSPFNIVIDLTSPSIPTNLMASARPGEIIMEWTANSEMDLAGYNVYRSTVSPVVKTTPINSGLVLSPSFIDTNVVEGTQYFYAVSAVDTSSNESNLSAEASATAIAPPPAEALDLGSSQAYVALGDNADIAQFTLETWLRRDGAGTATTTGTGGQTLVPLITNGTADSETEAADINYFLGIRGSDNVLCADFEEAQSGTTPGLNHPVCGTTPLATGAWYHVAATYNGTLWRLYLNGNLEAELSVGLPANANNTSQLAFGTSMKTDNTALGFFDGVLDEVRIWNYPRTQAQIVGTINQKLDTPQSGLIGRWGLDEATGSVIHDTSGSNITGTITGTGYSWVPGSPFSATVNLPPDAPVLVSPADTATGVPTSTTLSVNVSDPEGNPLNVTFYGRPKQAAAGPDFTLVVIPDPQYYASTYPSIYNAQMQWVADNKTNNNIVYVASLGDNVDVASNLTQWTNADAAYDILDGAGVPYGVGAGNHDGAPSGTGNFNTYFGTTRYSGQPTYGGHYGTDNDNHYALFTASGLKFIVIFIEYDDTMTSTDHPVLQWANGLIQSNSDRRGIVISHNMLQGGTSNTFTTQGQTIYNALKGNPNLFLIMGGHLDVAARRTDVYNGNTVYTLRSDYQSVDSQQSGYLRILRFAPSDDMIYVRTYSPTQNKDYDKSDAAQSNFSLPYAMDGVGFQALGTATGVPSGGTASITWSGLNPSAEYEWYVVASDGTHQTSSDTWTFTTESANHAPTCSNVTLTANEDTSGQTAPSCTDADSNPLTYSIVAQPTHGSASVVAGQLTYTPAANYTGGDSFTYEANDGIVDSNTATVTVTVNAVNDPPVISGQNPVSTHEDIARTIIFADLTVTDVDNTYPTGFTLTVLSGTNYTVVGNTITPAANFNGTLTVPVKVNDGQADSNTFNLSVTVTPVNDSPIISGQNPLSTPEDTARTIVFADLTVTDLDNTYPTGFTLTVLSGTNYTVVGNTITPTANFNGTLTVPVKVNDGQADSNTFNLSVTVTSVNDAPVCSNVLLSTDENVTGQTNPSCTDVDGNPLTYSIVAQPTHGSASVIAGKLSYTPTTNYSGPDSFTYKANDGTVDSNTATVTVTVIGLANHAPICSNVTLTTNEDASGQTTPSCTDADNNPLTYSIVSQPTHGSASVVAGQLTYTPAANYTGGDSFTYKANDGTVDSNTATVTVTVNAVNDAPVISGQNPISTPEDTARTIIFADLTVTDIDNTYPTGFTLTVLSGTNYTVVGNTLTPAANFNGSLTVPIKVNDGQADSNTFNLSVTVTPVNDAPVCSNVNLLTTENVSGQTAPSCTDVDGDPLTYSIVSQPSHGSASVVAGQLSYVPTAGYNGPDAFTYKANDGTVDSNTATVTVTVDAVNDPPVITEGSSINVVMSRNGVPTPFSLTLNATDVDSATLTWSISVPAVHGTASASGTGSAKSIGYTPALNYVGIDAFTVQVSDGSLTDSIVVNVTITAVNDPPTDIVLSKTNIDENQPIGSLVGTLTTSDPNAGDTFTYAFCGGADDASFQINGDTLQSAAIFDYETKASYSVCIRTTDGGSLSTTKNFTVTINNLIDTATFADVPTTHWAWQYVEALFTAQITGGCGINPLIYCPNTAVTRDQMAVFLLRGIHGPSYAPPDVGSSTGFNDVPVTYWAAAWIKQFALEGITAGCGNGNFCPNLPVTRDQMSVFLLRAKYGASYTPPAASGTLFADVPSTHWAAAWIEQLASEGITGGCGNGNFCPATVVTRDQMAVFLVRTFNLPLP